MKPPGRPGQYWSPDGDHIVRIAKRTNGCKGCVYEDCLYVCPGLQIKKEKRIDCELRRIIFVKPQ